MVDTLKNYTFLPWLRQGVATEIIIDDNLGGPSVEPERASVDVRFKAGGEPIQKTVHLLGPGDIIGISPRAIVKTEPRNWVTDFEANYLPYIEFYEEEFPWRFTPARAANTLEQTRLRPWIILIVLTEDEFSEKTAGGPLPVLEIKPELDPSQFFPQKDQTWAWAHVHVNHNVIGDTLLRTPTDTEVRGVEQKLSSSLSINPDNASSRLLCPRKLKESTAYHAFVIPAFEAGRLAGLGLDPQGVSGQKASWEDGNRLYPIYYRWFFRTGTKGDFEFLVDLLEARPVDKRVGVRDMDMQEPDYETSGMAPPLDVMGLEGALKSPQMEPFPEPWPPAGTVFENPPDGSAGRFLNDLEQKVNLQFDLRQEETSENVHRDPIISPPLYGRWHAKAEKLDVQTGTGWVDQLNRDPRYRAPAGGGTEVIQKDQENLMQQAWSQLGDLLRANQKIRQLQLGLMSSFAMYRRSVLPQSPDQFLMLTQPVQSRVLGSPVTIARQVQDSRVTRAATDPAFRKITRERGAIMRKAAPDTQTRPPILTLLNEGKLTAAPKPPEPTGQLSIDKVAESVDPKNIPDWLRQLVLNKTARGILLVVIAIAVLLAFVTGLLFIFIPIAVAAAGALAWTEKLRLQVETAATFREASFTRTFVDTIPARPNFVVTELRQPMPATSGPANDDSVEGANFRIALKDAFNAHETLPPSAPPREKLSIDTAVAKLKAALNPSVAIPKRAEFMLKIPVGIKDSYLLPRKTIVTVMAHPVFTQPMYAPLRDISSELLVPNLELIPNNTISLMETNQRFIEAYMVGLNHEMAAELLWREFPTDQRGSYFRQFWDVGDVINRDPNKTQAQLEEELLDIQKLHTWDVTSNLGAHANRPLPAGGDKDESRVVLVVRGDLLRKYPTVVIYAQRAKWDVEDGRDVRVLDKDADPSLTILDPIFKAEIDPDIRFLGFDLTRKVAKGSADRPANDPGWFFVLQERPGEPRFGLDNRSDDSPDTPTNWNKVAWEHLTNFESLDFINLNSNQPIAGPMTDEPDNQFVWGRNAADMAYIFYQVPVMVAFHAADMLA